MKLGWAAGETFGRSRLNQPFYVQSGVYDASIGALRLQISTGRMRFPYDGRPLNSFTGAQEVILRGVTISTVYSLFMTNDGQVMASGHLSFLKMPDPPRVNSEYIGSVQTFSPLATATLIGPWNLPASGYHETRGEYTAITPMRPRVMEAESYPTGGSAGTLVLTTKGQVSANLASNGLLGLAVGITTVQVGEPQNTLSLVQGLVQWMPSGQLVNAGGFLPSGTLRIAPQFWIERNASATAEFLTTDGRTYMTPQNPDDNTAAMVHNCPFAFVTSSGSANALATYALKAHLNPNLTDTGAGIRVVGYSLIVEPGKYRSVT